MPDPSYTLVARNAAGAVCVLHPDEPETPSESAAGYVGLVGNAPGSGITRVEIVHGGTVVAARDASAHAPTAQLLAPGRGARVGGRSLTVRWRSADADGDPLVAALDYSADGGTTWNNVFSGPDGGRASLPASLLAASHRARLRLTVSDGFNMTSAAGPRFTVAGRRPVARIQPAGARQPDRGRRRGLAQRRRERRPRACHHRPPPALAGRRAPAGHRRAAQRSAPAGDAPDPACGDRPQRACGFGDRRREDSSLEAVLPPAARKADLAQGQADHARGWRRPRPRS